VLRKKQGVNERYESEIARLKRELEARGGGGVTEPPEGSKPAEYERSMYPPALGAAAAPSNGDSCMYPSTPYPNTTMLTLVRSPYPPPGLRTDDRERQERDRVVSDRDRDRDRDRETPRGQIIRPIASPPTLLSDLDPENVSRELKKEGGDWVAVWSSQSKKMLDVSLVHTLNHET
jgi:glucose repression regulatory protein TUP1